MCKVAAEPRPAWRARDAACLILLVFLWPVGAFMVLLSQAWTRRQKLVGVGVSGFAIVVYPVLGIGVLVLISDHSSMNEWWKVAGTFVVGVPELALVVWAVVYLAKRRRLQGNPQMAHTSQPDLR
jgi:hypothetical protein